MQRRPCAIEVRGRAVCWGLALLLGGSASGPGCGGSVGADAGSSGPGDADGSAPLDASPTLDAPQGSEVSRDADSDTGIDCSAAPCESDASSPMCPPDAELLCYVDTHCPSGSGQTSLSGKVYDPAGRNPIFGAIVFVPNHPASLAPIATGASSCNTCENVITDYVAVAATDFAGSFTLRGVPAGGDVPLVIQAGKWRRLVHVPHVADCADTPVPPGLSRLPRSRTEGDLPQMALLTGGCDNFACFLRSVGIDAAEFTAPHAGGRVDVYQGLGAAASASPLSSGAAGDCTTAACPLWSSKQSLESYDAVLLGCECAENNQTKPPSSLQALHDWLGEGGHVFATHSQATWFKNGPSDFQAVASWTGGPASGATGPFAVDTTSPRGMNFQQWLANVGAANANIVPLTPADVSTSVTAVGPSTTAWIEDTSTAPEGGSPYSGNVKAFSFGTPIAAADAGTSTIPIYCGKAFFTDIHPGGGQALADPNADGPGGPAGVPGICDGGPMTAEEKALEFLFFLQTMCISTGPIKGGPPPPPDY